LASLFVLANCKDRGVGNPGATQPTCKWNAQKNISFTSIQLKKPSKELLHFSNCYSGNINSFTMIFGNHLEQEKSQIKITTTGKQCTGTKSKSQIFSRNNYSSKIWERGFSSINATSNGSTPTVKIEIKSGPHQDWEGGEGYVIWTKTLPVNNPYAVHSSQQGIFSSTYRQTKSATISTIYRNGRFTNLKIY
jgi:hypothetical protein